MKIPNICIRSTLLLMIPTMIAYPQCEMPTMHSKTIQDTFSSHSSFLNMNSERPISYDDVVELLEEIESGDIKNCSPEELAWINKFIVILAQQGILPHETTEELSALDHDIQVLLNPIANDVFGYSLESVYVNPGLFYGSQNPLLCKNWFKKQWDRTCKFVKHHKKEILIGAAIVIGVAVVVTTVVLTCGTTTGGAVALGGALAAAAQSSDESNHSPTPPKTEEHSSTQPLPPSILENPFPMKEPEILMVMPPISDVPMLREAIGDQISSFKETVSENIVMNYGHMDVMNMPSFLEKVRELGAYLAHETLETISHCVSDIPKLSHDVLHLASELAPYSFDHPVNFEMDFENRIASGHQIIDSVFGSNQAYSYTPEGKELGAFRQPEITYGVLPPPGFLGRSSALLTEGRLTPTMANSTWGWKVGDPIQNKTWWGGIPKWSTVRQRHWKNTAINAKSDPTTRFTQTDISRMEKGLAPQRPNKITGQIESMELHHIPPQREGGLFDFIEVWPEEHVTLDPNRHLGR